MLILGRGLLIVLEEFCCYMGSVDIYIDRYCKIYLW